MIQAIAAGNIILPILYGLVFAAYLAAFVTKGAKRAERWTALLLPAALLHVGYLVLRMTALGHVPLLSRYEAMSTIALCVILFYLVQERQVNVRAVGVFIVGPAFLLQVISSLGIQHLVMEENDQFKGLLFRFHVLSSILAYVGFAVAAFYGVLYLLLFQELRNRKPGFVFARLPALETLSRLNRRAMTLAFSLLTFGLVTGTYWAHKVVENFSILDPKQIGSLLIWILYALFVALSTRGRWHGRAGAITSLIGFGTLLAVFLALNLVFHSFHDYL